MITKKKSRTLFMKAKLNHQWNEDNLLSPNFDILMVETSGLKDPTFK